MPVKYEKQKPPHPGRYIKDTLKSNKVTVTAAAKELGLNRVMLTRIVNGQHPVSAKTAFLFERWVGNDDIAIFLLTLQAECDLWELKQEFPVPESVASKK